MINPYPSIKAALGAAAHLARPLDYPAPAIPIGEDWRSVPACIRLWLDLDPRLTPRSSRHNGGFGVNDASRAAHAVLAEGSVSNSWASVNDPRVGCKPRAGTMGVSDAERPSSTVIGVADIHNSAVAVADPRSHCKRREDAIGVSNPARPYKTAVIGHQKVENSPTSVADPRVAPQNRGTRGRWLCLHGNDAQVREHIGNAVPPATAKAIGEQVLEVLDAGRTVSFRLSQGGVWVRPEREGARA